MASFDLYFPKLLQLEGGYQNYASDTGNYNSLGQNVGTNYGITAKTYEAFINRPPSVYDMKNITPATAKAIYKSMYWDKIKADSIKSQSIAEILFDGYVNMGGYAVRIMQKLVGTTADGVVGNMTLAAINSKSATTLYNAYRAARIEYYKYLGGAADVAQDWFNYFATLGLSRSYDEFLRGWLNRMDAFPILTKENAAKGGLLLLLIATAYITYKIV